MAASRQTSLQGSFYLSLIVTEIILIQKIFLGLSACFAYIWQCQSN